MKKFILLLLLVSFQFSVSAIGFPHNLKRKYEVKALHLKPEVSTLPQKLLKAVAYFRTISKKLTDL